MTDNNDTSTYFDRSEFLKAQKAPEYAVSARYRAEVAAKLDRSLAAGTVQPLGQYFPKPGEGSSFHTRIAKDSRIEEGAIYGGVQALPGVDPVWKAAQDVGKAGSFFAGPEEIALAMSAPHYQSDPSYQRMLKEKIDRSIRERWIGTDFQALDLALRFTR